MIGLQRLRTCSIVARLNVRYPKEAQSKLQGRLAALPAGWPALQPGTSLYVRPRMVCTMAATRSRRGKLRDASIS